MFYIYKFQKQFNIIYRLKINIDNLNQFNISNNIDLINLIKISLNIIYVIKILIIYKFKI